MKILAKIILVLAILIAIISIALILFNKFYLSGILISKFTKLLEQETARKVEIKNASFNLFNGVSVSDIKIFEKDRPTITFLKINSLSAKLSFLPFFKDQKLNIPVSIKSSNVEIFINRETKNMFNFSSLKILQTTPQKKPKSQSKILVLPSTIQLKNIKLHFKDTFSQPDITKAKTLNIKNAYLRLSLPIKLSFQINANLNSGISTIAIQGDFFPITKDLSASLNITNLAFEEYKSYLPNIPFVINTAVMEETQTKISLKNRSISLKTQATLKDLNIENKKIKLKGKFLIDATLDFNFLTKNIDYQGNLKPINAYLSGITFLKQIDRITGDIKFSKDLLETKNITGFVLDTPISLEGRLYDFADPYLYMHFLSAFNPSVLNQLLEEKIKNKQLTFDGKTRLDLTLEGRPKAKKHLDYSGELNITELKIAHPSLNTPITIKNAKALIKDNIVTANNIAAHYKNSGINTSLSVDINDLTDARLKSSGEINLDFSDLASDKLALSGSAKGNLKINTRLKDLTSGILNLDLNTDIFGIQGITFKNTSVEYTQIDDLGQLSIASEDTYDGNAQITSTIQNPFSNNASFSGEIKIDNVDLAKLKLDTGLKTKKLSGILTTYTRLYGRGIDTKTLTGDGVIQISDGHLWEIDFLKAISDILSLKSLVKFSECAGTFQIKNNKATTQDLYLISEDKDIQLNITGSVGFNKQLDLNIKTNLTGESIIENPNILKLPELILGAGASFLNIRVFGPWDDVKTRVEPAAMDDFEEGIKGSIEKIKDIFGGIKDIF